MDLSGNLVIFKYRGVSTSAQDSSKKGDKFPVEFEKVAKIETSSNVTSISLTIDQEGSSDLLAFYGTSEGNIQGFRINDKGAVEKLNKIIDTNSRTSGVTTLLASNDASLLIGGYQNGEVVVFHLEKSTLQFSMVEELRLHEASITGIQLSPDSSLLLTSSEDQHILAWAFNKEFLSFKEIGPLGGIQSDSIEELRMSTGGSMMIGALKNGNLLSIQL